MFLQRSFVGLCVQAGHWAGAECSQCQSQSRGMNAVQSSQVGVWCRAIHNATIVKLEKNNGTVQHQERVSVPSPFQVSNHSDQVESLLALCLQHTDLLLKWEVRVKVSFASWSTISLPLMPQWLGTQQKADMGAFVAQVPRGGSWYGRWEGFQYFCSQSLVSKTLNWIGLRLFNDDTCPSGHISRPSQVGFSHSYLRSINEDLWWCSVVGINSTLECSHLVTDLNKELCWMDFHIR